MLRHELGCAAGGRDQGQEADGAVVLMQVKMVHVQELAGQEAEQVAEVGGSGGSPVGRDQGQEAGQEAGADGAWSLAGPFQEVLRHELGCAAGGRQP